MIRRPTTTAVSAPAALTAQAAGALRARPTDPIWPGPSRRIRRCAWRRSAISTLAAAKKQAVRAAQALRAGRTFRAVFAVLLLGVVLPAAARAEANLEEKMTLYVNDADAGELLQSFAHLTSSTLDLDAAWKSRKVSLRIERVTLHEALNALCSAAGCAWQLDQGRLKVRPAPAGSASANLAEPIDLKVTDADLRELLIVAAQILSASPEIDPALAGVRVSFEFDHERVAAVLDALCKGHCHWQLTSGEKPALKVTAP